jgi:hypothetical protein
VFSIWVLLLFSHALILCAQRFASLYALDYRDPRHYDIRIDTTPNTAAQTLRQTLAALVPVMRRMGLEDAAAKAAAAADGESR